VSASISPRLLASRVVLRVVHEGAFSNLALGAELDAAQLEPRDRALATELVYGALTWRPSLDRVLDVFVKGGIGRLDPEVHAVLLVALYQMLHLDRVPARAAVDEAVRAIKRLSPRGERVAGVVNGVLRNVLRQPERHPTAPDRDRDLARHIAHRTAMPRWVVRLLLEQHPEAQVEALCFALTERPPLTVRVCGPPESWQERRDALLEPLGATASETAACAATVAAMTPAVRDALERGQVAIQDLGSQLIALAAAPPPGARILDACAGLGDKAALLADLAGPGGQVVAVDPNASKLDMLRATFERCGLPPATTLHATLQEAAPRLAADFDVVLVDAPCTGLGVLRRHPETRWRVEPSDVERLAAVQADLLDLAVSLVRGGGALVYSVCTFTRAEGPDQVDRLLAAHPDLVLEAPPSSGVDWAALVTARGDFALRPVPHQTDGFYLARLRRAP